MKLYIILQGNIIITSIDRVSAELEWQDAEYAMCFDADGYYYRIDMSKLSKKHPRLVHPSMLVKCDFITHDEYAMVLDLVDRYEEECSDGWDDACKMLDLLAKFRELYLCGIK